MTDRTPRGDHVALTINGLMAGAGSFYLMTRSVVATVVVAVAAVVLIAVLARGEHKVG